MSRRLRILILGLNYAPEPTGIAPYTTGMARFLADAGHDVHVVTGFPHYPTWKVADGYRGRRMQEWDGKVRITRVWHPVPQKPTGRSRVTLEAVFALQAAAVAGARPDVVLAVSPALLTVATTLRWRSPGRTVVGVIAQDLYSRAIVETGAMGGRGARVARRLESALLRRADGVIAIHDSFRRSLVGLGVEDRRITVIRNWTHVAQDVGNVVDLRARLGWNDDETVVLHAGNMGAKQGLENVIDAARLADRRGSALKFVLLGHGNQRTALELRARGVDHLQILDPLPSGEFETALAAADILLLNERPGIEEMCVPSKLTSYFSSGRPVVAATSPRSAAASEIVSSGGGVLVQPGQPEALLEQCETLVMDPARGVSMGMQGQVFARGMLSGGAARAAYLRWVEGLAAPADALPIPSGYEGQTKIDFSTSRVEDGVRA